LFTLTPRDFFFFFFFFFSFSYSSTPRILFSSLSFALFGKNKYGCVCDVVDV